MQALGCFGSSLAFDEDHAACKACSAAAECEALVTSRRPTVLRLLTRFSDSRGNSMALHWLTPEERKRLKDMQSAVAVGEAQDVTYGDRAVAVALRAQMNKFAFDTFDKMTLERIDVRSASLESISSFSDELGEIVTQLQTGGRTVSELTAALVDRFSFKASTAQRYTYSLISILAVCERVKRVKHTWELA